MLKRTPLAPVSLCALLSAACLALPATAEEVSGNASHTPNQAASLEATDGPAQPSTWSYAVKQGIGSSYEAYKDLHYADDAATGTVSKVWFSLADGVITETMYGLIHEAQIRELQIVIVGDGYTAFEKDDTTARIAYLHTDANGRPLSPAYKITTTDKQGRFEIEKHVFTNPDNQSLMVRVVVKALKGPVTPYVLLDPSVANTGGSDEARASKTALQAFEGDTALSLTASVPFVRVNAGFAGVSDGLNDLRTRHKLGKTQGSTVGTPANVVLLGQLPKVSQTATFDLALGFGKTPAAAQSEAKATLKTGYAEVLARYNGEGAHIGWEDYLASLDQLPRLSAISTDGGKLLYASALMLKVQEDRTYAGALIASLSNPWGETVTTNTSATGYKAVWPRDFYQVAMALAALGDKETPLAAYHYLPKVQVGPNTPGNHGDGGWFLQKAHVDGTPEWIGVQLDQTANPIMLGWNLNAMGLMSDADLLSSWETMLKPAARFLKDGGTTNIGWNNTKITPPYTQQERWEEQEGHSPSTTAAVITGLIAAADIADRAGDKAFASELRQSAKNISDKIEPRTVTTTGKIRGGKETYYLRLSRTEDANNPGSQDLRNGREGIDGDLVIDGGFLELVRYGVRRADDKYIVATLPIYEDESLPENLRVKYSFRFDGVEGTFPGFRRYGNDGYGEDQVTGGNYAVLGQSTPNQRGRVWPFFTGERGHYEIALAGLKPEGVTDADRARVRQTYIKGMELFANQGLMLPEQVWDGVGTPPPHGKYTVGQGTNSATPLAWTHAEYVKLLRSTADGKVWDLSPITANTFAK
ncbi:MAG: glucan 1,4-alpha-glucosidase [Asticcacaulis sp.]